MLSGQHDGVVVVVKEDDHKSAVMMKEVSMSVSGRNERVCRDDTSVWPDDPGQMKGAAGGDGTGEEVQLVAVVDGEDDAGHKPRGCAENSRNLINKKGEGSFQFRRRSKGIQSQILLFENFNQRGIEPGPNTENDRSNHVGGGGRKWFPGAQLN